MRALSLLGTLLLAKAIVLFERNLSWSPWAVLAFFWQDVFVVLCFALLDARLRSARLAWIAYGIICSYVAINVPLTELLSTPLTWPMMRAARGALGDSVRHHFIWTNVWPIAVVLLCALGVPILTSRYRLRPHWTIYALATTIVAFGPLAATRFETQGLHRNALFALLASTIPRIEAKRAIYDWRVSPYARPPEEAALKQFYGLAAGRNVVLVLLESTGAAYLRAYGAAEDPTPNLTALTEESIVVENTYAVYPESIKGLFSVLCSQFPAFDTQPEIYETVCDPSVAKVLREAGYRAGLFHSGRFDYLGMHSIIRNRGFEILEDAGDIGGNHKSSFGVDEPATVRRVLQWIASLASTEKFFITYLPIAGHHPYDSPNGGPFPAAGDLGRYHNALHYGDAALGELIRELRKRGLYEKTLFIFAGDHGEAFGQHAGNFAHTLSIYEENVRVPCIITAPGLFKKRTQLKEVASLIDIAPTVLDLLGIQAPRAFQGRSLLAGSNRMALFYTDYSLGFLGLRDGNWKLIYELESGRAKLFDLQQDPLERTNSASKYPDRARLYRERLLQWSAAQRERVLRGSQSPLPQRRGS